MGSTQRTLACSATLDSLPAPNFTFNSNFITGEEVAVEGGAFNVDVTNADITNFAIAEPVPEPGTLLLLGSGISAPGAAAPSQS